MFRSTRLQTCRERILVAKVGLDAIEHPYDLVTGLKSEDGEQGVLQRKDNRWVELLVCRWSMELLFVDAEHRAGVIIRRHVVGRAISGLDDDLGIRASFILQAWIQINEGRKSNERKGKGQRAKNLLAYIIQTTIPRRKGRCEERP